MRAIGQVLSAIAAMALCALASAAEFRELPGGELEAATSTTLLIVRHGQLARVENRLTSETLASDSAAPHAGTRLLYELGMEDEPSSSSVSQNEITQGRAFQLTRLASGATITTIISVEANGAIRLFQEAHTPQPGLEQIVLGLPALAPGQAVLVPTGAGVRLDNDFDSQRRFRWPSDWRVQEALIETPAGGFLVRADDPAFEFFKSLHVRGSNGALWLSLATEIPQPVGEKTQGRSAAWLIQAFEGSWAGVAETERQRLRQIHEADLTARGRRRWFEDVRLIVTPARMRESLAGPLDLERHTAFLDALAQRVDPATTIVNFALDWRRAEMGSSLPTMEANLNFESALKHADALGFRTMIAIDVRCDELHPLYAELRRAHMRYGMPQPPPYGQGLSMLGAEFCSFVQRPLWKIRAGAPETRLAVINPAIQGWRDVLVAQAAKAYNQLHPDVIHLKGITYVNDANGLFGGVNSIQGCQQLLAAFRKSLPLVAVLSTDAWDEVSLGYADAAQLALPGLLEVDPSLPAAMQLDESQIGRLHPVSALMMRRDLAAWAPFYITDPDFAQACAAWEMATVCQGPLVHAFGIDEPMLNDAPLALRAQFQQARTLREIRADLDPAAWHDDAAQVRWQGPSGAARIALNESRDTVRFAQVDGQEETVYEVGLNGRYEGVE